MFKVRVVMEPLSKAAKVPMVFHGVTVGSGAAPIAAFVVVLGPSSDRPAALRPAASAEDRDSPALSPARNVTNERLC